MIIKIIHQNTEISPQRIKPIIAPITKNGNARTGVLIMSVPATAIKNPASKAEIIGNTNPHKNPKIPNGAHKRLLNEKALRKPEICSDKVGVLQVRNP